MKLRTTVIAALAALLLAPAAASAHYVTIMLGRANYAVTAKCQVLPQSVTLDQVASDLAARGLRVTVAITPQVTPDSDSCVTSQAWQEAGWSTLSRLQSEYGLDAVPRGASDDRGAFAADQATDSCGLLPAMYDHGFADAWGMYAYYGNEWSDAMQAGVVSSCFAYGRHYGGNGQNALPGAAPFYAFAKSFNGGYCADMAAACHGVRSPHYYDQPSAIGYALAHGDWAIVQGYRFVTGSYGKMTSSGQAWDCTASDPAEHWSNRSEVYCYADFLTALDMIPPGSVDASPADAARASGRQPA